MDARRDRAVVIVVLLFGYASFYLCRANLDAANPLLIATFGYTKTQLGTVSSVSVLSYAIGKLLLGALGDRIGGKRVMLLAMGGSIGATYLIGFSSGGLVSLALLASVNRFFQAGGWGGLIHVVSRWFPPARHGTVMGLLSTSYELGNLLTLLLCGSIVHAHLGWRALFLVNPTMFLVVTLAVAFLLRGAPPASRPAEEPKAAEAPAEPVKADADAIDEPASSLREALAFLLRNRSFWIAVLLSALLTFIRTGFNTWTPTFLVESTGGDQAGSMVKAAVFPACGIVAAIAAGRVSDRFGRGRRAPVMATSLVVHVVMVLLLAHAHVTSVHIVVLLVGACGLFLMGPYSLLGGAVTLDVAGKRAAATAAGIIDGVGYIGASASGYVLGRVADRYGWSRVFDVIAGAATVATITSAAWWRSLERRKKLQPTDAPSAAIK